LHTPKIALLLTNSFFSRFDASACDRQTDGRQNCYNLAKGRMVVLSPLAAANRFVQSRALLPCVSAPNGISIGSAVSAQLTRATNTGTQTDPRRNAYSVNEP